MSQRWICCRPLPMARQTAAMLPSCSRSSRTSSIRWASSSARRGRPRPCGAGRGLGRGRARWPGGHVDGLSGGQRQGRAQHLLELADVVRPGVREQGARGGRLERRRFAAPAEQRPHEQPEVLRPLAQRRQRAARSRAAGRAGRRGTDQQPLVPRATRGWRRRRGRRPRSAVRRRAAPPGAPAAPAAAPPARPGAGRRSRRGTASRRRPPARSPVRSDTAPEKAPRRCPNSSASASASGSAPQLTATKAPPRLDSAWTARATSSLPVPVSPPIRTDCRVGATRSSCSSLRASAGDRVASPAGLPSRALAARSSGQRPAAPAGTPGSCGRAR